MSFTGKADGTVYAIFFAKGEKEGIPENVEIPAELAAKAGKITLLGYGAVTQGSQKRTGFDSPARPVAPSRLVPMPGP